MVEVNNITKSYNKGTFNEVKLFDGFNLTVNKGDFISVVGSNGSGKTTLLNIICGSTKPDSGRVLLDGNDITAKKEYERARFIGRVYQNPAAGTCPGMTILENMSLADNKVNFFSLTPGINKKRIDYYRELLKQLNIGLQDKLHIRVSSLSGGQRQALSLLMSTMTDIKLLILDEHTAALDPKTSEVIINLTNDIVRQKSITTVMVTHNLRHAAAFGNRIIMMHEGGIVIDKKNDDKDKLTFDLLFEKFNELNL